MLAFAGGILGVLMMVPLRQALIVKEHGVLPYPEGTACADVLVAGERGGALARTVFMGLTVGAIWKALSWILQIFRPAIGHTIPRTRVFPDDGCLIQGERQGLRRRGGAGRPAAHRARHAADGRPGRLRPDRAVPGADPRHADAVELRRRGPDRHLRVLLRDRLLPHHRPH